MIKEAIVKIVGKQDLTYDEAYAVMNEIMSGAPPPRTPRSWPPFPLRAPKPRWSAPWPAGRRSSA